MSRSMSLRILYELWTHYVCGDAQQHWTATKYMAAAAATTTTMSATLSRMYTMTLESYLDCSYYMVYSVSVR